MTEEEIKERAERMSWKEAAGEDRRVLRPLWEEHERELKKRILEWERQEKNSSSSSGGEKEMKIKRFIIITKVK